jgi:hypothetical protein
VVQFEAVQFEVVQFEAVSPIVAVRSFAGEPSQPVADIVIRTIKIAVVAVMWAGSIVAAQSQAVPIVAVSTQEVAPQPEAALLPVAEAHVSPTAVVDAVGDKSKPDKSKPAVFSAFATLID